MTKTDATTTASPAVADRDNVCDIASDMEDDLTDIEQEIRALIEVVEFAGDRQDAAGRPADVPYHVVRVLSNELMEDFRSLDKKWARVLELACLDCPPPLPRGSRLRAEGKRPA